MGSDFSTYVTLATSFIGWVVIISLHVHMLRRDAASRKKDKLQGELDSLLEWSLDTDRVISTPKELRETFLAGKITSIEFRHDEVYNQYFVATEDYSCISDLRDLDVYGLDDKEEVQNFQIEVVNIAMMISDAVEQDYGHYCRQSWVHRKIFSLFLKIPIKPFPLLFGFFSFIVLYSLFIYVENVWPLLTQ